MKSILLIILKLYLLICISSIMFAKAILIPTDSSQTDFTNAYKFVLNYSSVDMRFTNSTMDSILFPKYGEFSIYWINNGINKGSFVYPDAIPNGYSTIAGTQMDSFEWSKSNCYSIQYKPNTQLITIFKSEILNNNNSVSWEYLYFKNMFDSYLFNNIYCFTNESTIDSIGISASSQLLIIPSFDLKRNDSKYYIDSVFNHSSKMKTKIDAFLARGGTIYAEGNAVYFIEKLGYLEQGSADFSNSINSDPITNLLNISFTNSNNPISFTEKSVNNCIYGSTFPIIKKGNYEIIAQHDTIPITFILKSANANGGRIICNTGLPTIGGINQISQGSRQLQWTLNSIMYAFTKNIDITRSVYNNIPDSITAGKNAIAHDAIDTFEVRILVRNLSNYPQNDITIREYIREYFNFVDVITPGITTNITGKTLTISGLSIPANSQKIITYRLQTPSPNDAIHEKINNYISWANYIYASYNSSNYNDNNGYNTIIKYRNYVDVMFSANIVADADLNWKNFLGLYYQPFKVFMIMENKERTAAMQTEYIQYIPKDVPFYWTDSKINIPVLRTPGGKFVDVLKGSNNEAKPDFDMDSDTHPDVWLDTSSIYPKGYTIIEDSVYWLNPWEHLRSGDSCYYEDIDHDGKHAIDINSDGIVDIDEPGDKIRVWKLTWNIGKVVGYEFHDPYCYYEIWVDPPDLMPLSAGIGYAYDLVKDSVNGMFYPFSKDIKNSNLADTSWSNWMERGKNGKVIWKQLIWQKLGNYEGYAYIDTNTYKLKPSDILVGTVPQPHREFIAVLSLGGEEIDMTKPTPNNSLYSKLNYKTIFNESKTTPIRTTYTYWAPLPNPLQFEYLSNCFVIKDSLNKDTLEYLPHRGKANLIFNIDASTEYTYYWIRNVGHDVDYNDPSEQIEGDESMGDGVFGYMIYDIPKGLGGYKISLSKNQDGSYNTDEIVQIDGKPFTKWLDNPNTKNSVEIWEDQYQYHIYIPQILIPPALDDDNFDGIDDWIDDRGDRFHSSSGYLHDLFMIGKGEEYPAGSPNVYPHLDDIYGKVDSGWSAGKDNSYGDDFFENLGKTQIQIHAIYQGLGKEGLIEISKGGWLVVEEIFGGSPWVINSHVLSSYAKGSDIKISSQSVPSTVKYGLDTTYIKYIIQDSNEPHFFDSNFDPYHISYGYGNSTITTNMGAKDPCSLIVPQISGSAIIDPIKDAKTVCLIPNADGTNPELTGYPKFLNGTFIECIVEVMNGTDDNWIDTRIEPVIPPALKNSNLIMKYVAYPRPLVPAKVDPATGKVIQAGDDIGVFRAGWRFNQPEGEVLIKMGNTLPLLQPSRRAYFVFLFGVDQSLNKGIYQIDYTFSGIRKHYNNQLIGDLNYKVPPAKFSIVDKDKNGNIIEYQKTIIGESNLKKIKVNTTEYFDGLQNVKWAVKDINQNNFDTLDKSINAIYNSNIETIDLSLFKNFPSIEIPIIYILEQGQVYSYGINGNIDITLNQQLSYSTNDNNEFVINDLKNTVSTTGPKIDLFKRIYSINNVLFDEKTPVSCDMSSNKDIAILVQVTNSGNDINQNTIIQFNSGNYFLPIEYELPENSQIINNTIVSSVGSIVPGETKTLYYHFNPINNICSDIYNNNKSTVINNSSINYIGTKTSGTFSPLAFSYPDNIQLDLPVIDMKLECLTINYKKIKIGDNIQLTANCKNGVLPVQDAEISIYALQNMSDTVLIDEYVLTDFLENQTYTHTVNYTVPDTVNYIEFFAKIDSKNKVNEFCENNNQAYLKIPFDGPNWILNVKTNPNPMIFKTEFSYLLPREMKKIDILFYTIEGREVSNLVACPISIGKHSVTWYSPDNYKGTYLYLIKGIRPDGRIEEYRGKIIKE